MGALEGAVEDVGVKVGAGEGCDVFWEGVEVGCAPCAAPGEVFGGGSGGLLVFVRG